MTPKEKALELFEKHLRYTPEEFEGEYAKKACLITVDEILENVLQGYYSNEYGTSGYWQEVKEEIEKL